MRIRLATRGSALALWQAERVAALIRAAEPEMDVELVRVSTRPDRQPETPLAKLGGDKGLFVKEVEDAILRGDADAAVHSLKDVPAELEPGLELVAYPERADPRDVLLTRNGETLDELPAGARVATSSLRRRGQLLRLRPDLKAEDIRGNVDTRAAKLRAGEFDAIVLAAAGLGRLGLLGENAHLLDPDVVIPAAGQGVIAIEAPTNSEFRQLWAKLDDAQVKLCAESERAFVRTLGAGCRTSAACHSTTSAGASVWIHAMVCGSKGHPYLTTGRNAEPTAALVTAQQMAEELLAMGADKLLDDQQGIVF